MAAPAPTPTPAPTPDKVIATELVTTCDPFFFIGRDKPCHNYYTNDITSPFGILGDYHICESPSGLGSTAKNQAGSYTCRSPGEKTYLDCKLVDSNNDEGGCEKKN